MPGTLEFVRQEGLHTYKPTTTKGVGIMSNKYAATYKIGNATVHIVAPPPMTEEEVEHVLREYHTAGWAIIEELIMQEQNKQDDI